MAKPDIRYLNDMKEVIYDQKWLKKATNFELYYMYRNVKEKGDLRYDITKTPPRFLGKEFVKTQGHGHRGNFEEIYVILKGKAIFLMQKCKNDKIEDVYAVKARKGDVCIIPKGYSHITINPSNKETLKTANWVSKKCKNDYSFIQKKGGACYFYTKSGWIKNKNYKNIPKLCFEKPLKKIPKNLDFLNPVRNLGQKNL